ncbi:hypothetical protein [Roseobacter sp. TSBP12]|jgi:hypothetical protein|uniref:hypothetical protein n=1 Tax=Roseobacter sp. TSBP12 TaxID=1236613 RepID=UPI00125F740C|nr:hypothetical protein [Roseobacter sp. TSBP12]KAB6717734.1 hypothetical protein C8029_04230 [Roseobacter sp. TSBP12]
MADLKLTLADQLLANAVMCIAGAPITVSDDDVAPMVVEIMKELIPHANRDHWYVGKLVDAAEIIVAQYRERKPGYANDAFQEARRATRLFAFWRLGEGYEIFKQGRAA